MFCTLCPSRSKTETLSETGWLPGMVWGKPSGAFVSTLGGRRQPPDPLVGIQPHSEAGRTIPKSVLWLLRPREQPWVNSGVDRDPGVVGAFALGGTRRVSGPPEATLRPPISIAVSVSI